MTSAVPLLVSAGEASGDRIAALTLSALGSEVRAFGMGGLGCAAAGMEMLVPLASASVMGFGPVVRRARALAGAFLRLEQAARTRRPCAALLVGFTTFHQALGRRLRSRGIRVLWCVAPQVWAWRPSRLATLRTSIDRLAVVLPFEEALWRNRGYDATYVGHPAVDAATWRQDEGPGPRRVLVLPGSRDQEVRATAEPLLAAARRWCDGQPGWSAEAVIATSLSPGAEAFLERQARRHRIATLPADPLWGAADRMHTYEIALCASGTASLEAALSGVPPIVAYRCDPVTAWLARRFLRTPHIALPNVLLGRRAFPELVQGSLSADNIVRAMGALTHDVDRTRAACASVRERMTVNDGASFAPRMASWVRSAWTL